MGDDTRISHEDLYQQARALFADGRQHWIGGELVAAQEADEIAVYDPSTGAVLGELQGAGPADVDAAFDAAAAAQPAWEAIGPYERMRTLERLADALEEHVEPLAWIEALDSGNPLKAMRKDIAHGIRILRYMASLGLGLHGSTVQTVASQLHYTLLRPYGVVGRIIPFNHPAMFFISKAAAPLITGNSVIMKPPEQAPLTAMYLGRIFNDVLPPGLVNVVAGGGRTGDALVRHPAIKRISFTGSVATAMRIQVAAASVGIKNVSMELGGKNPMVVLPDADIDAAVEATVTGMNLTVCQGQSCGSNSRILIHEDIRAPYEQQLADRLGRIRVGTAYDPTTDMGPLVSEPQYERVQSYLAIAREERIPFLFGGGRPEQVPDGGYFVQPTALSDPAPESVIAREEIFGPVISIMPWRDLDAAMALANDTEYGLTASVWTQDVSLAHRLAQQFEAGYVWINQHGPHHIGTPFGGFKASGTAREESIEELVSYCEVQAVHLDHK